MQAAPAVLHYFPRKKVSRVNAEERATYTSRISSLLPVSSLRRKFQAFNSEIVAARYVAKANSIALVDFDGFWEV